MPSPAFARIYQRLYHKTGVRVRRAASRRWWVPHGLGGGERQVAGSIKRAGERQVADGGRAPDERQASGEQNAPAPNDKKAPAGFL